MTSNEYIHRVNLGSETRYNLSTPLLVEASLSEEKGVLTKSGAIAVDTGKYTGRSPKDKYFVEEHGSKGEIWWGEVNQPISEETFEELYDLVCSEYDATTSKPTYVFEGFAGADPKYRIKVRVIAKLAWQAHFVSNMFIQATPEELEGFEPDFTIVNASAVKNANYRASGMHSETFVAFHLGKSVALIGGTEYGGEMKKGIFSVLNFLLPLKGVLPMHSSCNVDLKTGSSALFFGLSGTGKTTLSNDPERLLVGDDEHGWSDDGVFNFEGGCYAKVIDLNAEEEPLIYNAIRFGAQLENVVLDEASREVDYSDTSKTQNTRVSYPIEFIKSSLASRGLPSMAGHPEAVIFLTCDAFGVLPPVSVLSPGQAMYHFISGYTAKVAGTELGVAEPKATFSPCFGGPFLPLHPLRYANLLKQKLKRHGAQAYLVNTGWSGASASSGAERISLKETRKIISAILNGELKDCDTESDPVFNLSYPLEVEGVSLILDPVKAWSSREEYLCEAEKLSRLFSENFAKYLP
jgi:phosphoenolpyruvate carboxykinase (ATP)